MQMIFTTVFKCLSSASLFNSMGDNNSYERSVCHYYLMFLLSLCEGTIPKKRKDIVTG